MNKKDIHIVFIHGFIFNKTIWNNLAEKLTQDYTVHQVDLPGYSQHADIKANDLSEVAQYVLSQVHDKKKFIWVGFSLGGLIARYLAKNYQENTLGVITLASNPKFIKNDDWNCGASYGAFHMLKNLFIRQPDKALMRFLLLQGYNIDNKYTESLAQEVILRDLDLLEQNDLRPLMSEITGPQLNIFAQNDRLVPISIIEKLNHLSPTAQNVTIKDAGHALLLSHTQECLTVIENFINESIITQ
jgi:pimeloyl-[acyl-carrier protein] methyl ester esterase